MTSEEEIIQGIPISSGLAEGFIYIHQSVLPIDIPDTIGHRDIRKETNLLDESMLKISDDLFALSIKVEQEMDKNLAKVFGVHKLIVDDVSLKTELRKEISENLLSASSAVKKVFLRWEKRFLLMESQIARNKSDDMQDISNRLQNALAKIIIHPLENVPPKCVLIASRLLPSDTVFLSSRSIAAILLEHGSIGSHAALFAREMDVPCIARIPNLLNNAYKGKWSLVDADSGNVVISPDKNQKNIFQIKIDKKKHSQHLAQKHASKPAITKDGIRVSVLANVGYSNDTKRAILNGAEGIGLYRIEQAYLGLIEPPSTQDILNEMRFVLQAAKNLPVYVRLLDIGADKPLPFMKFIAETNPSLGRRGIRYLREYPQLLITHLKALLELSKEFDVSILVPMVTLPEDVIVVKEYLIELSSELEITSIPKLGAMIETPAAALSVKEIAKHVDFLSFGTNDLTQYSFAADRENAAVEKYFNDSSDVIFRLLKIACDDASETPVSVCGELAGRAEYVAKLLQCGIKALSVAPSLIPSIKELIRKLSFHD